MASLERLELVWERDTQASFADAARAVAAFANVPLSETPLAGAELREFAARLKCGAYYPVLFDNEQQVEVSQPGAIVAYIARLGGVDGGGTLADATRATAAAEAALRFLREGAATAPPAAVSAHIAALHGILSQVPLLSPAAEPAVTYGDVLAWLYLHRVSEARGEAALGALTGVYRAFAANERLAAYAAAHPAPASGPPPAAAGGPAPPGPQPALPVSDGPVLVTGAAGFIGSWTVRLLLEAGATVHGTVRSLSDPVKVAHITGLPGAAERLRLFEADLLVPASFDAAIRGCVAVAHTASPFFMTATDPAAQLIAPAVQGTRAVLRAAIACSTVRAVVVTSSAAAVYVGGPSAPADAYYTEDCWSDVEFLRATKQSYAESKVLAEREAWRVVAEEVPPSRPLPLRLVTLCPTQTLGPLLQPTINTSCAPVLAYLKGEVSSVPNKGKCFVDVRDVAAAHVRALFDPSATGRYLLAAQSIPWRVFADVLRRTLPGAPVPTRVDDGPASYPQALWSMLRTASLGVVYTPVETSIRDCALSMYSKGLLAGVIAPVPGVPEPGSVAAGHAPGHISMRRAEPAGAGASAVEADAQDSGK